MLLAHALLCSGIIGHVSTIPPRIICPFTRADLQKMPTIRRIECPWIIAETYLTCQTSSVHDHRRSPRNLWIQPRYIIGIHVHASVTAVACVRLITGCIIVGEIHPWPVVCPPPAIMKEVTASMILHRILDRRRWIPESRPGWLS